MKYKFITVCLLALLAFACAEEPPVQSPSAPLRPEVGSDDNSVLKGWVRIKLQNDASPLRTGVFSRGGVESGNHALDEVVSALGATELRRSFGDGGKFAERRRKYGFHLWYDIKIDGEIPVSRAQSELSDLPGVAHAQPIYSIRPVGNTAGLPAEMVYDPAAVRAARESEGPFDDPELGRQWHYNNDGTLPRSVAGADINLFEAWKRTAGDPSVIVAVTDGGVDWDHPDLAANMWVNETELNGKPDVDDDDNGYIDDIYGWNCMRESGEIVPNSHGTHVAGTVAAVNNNGKGVCGVAGGSGNGDGARIMSCQVFDDVESGKGAEAYLYAAENGAVISQNSWVYSTLGVLPQDFSDAFDYFIETAGTDKNGNQTGPMKGGILIFAAGNDNVSSVKLPARDPRMIAVTGMGPDYTKAGYSNYGDEADIFAPGGAASADSSYPEICRVYSTDNEGGYCYMSGTSMATPHVSGIAALAVSYYGAGKSGFTPEDLKKILLRSYRPVNGYIDSKYIGKLGVGLIDAEMIFMDECDVPPASVTNQTAAAIDNAVTLSWTVPADGSGLPVAEFVVSYTGKGIGKFEGRDDVSGTETFRNYADVDEEIAYSLALNYNTSYSFEVAAVDRYGNVSEAKMMEHSTGHYENEPPKAMKRFGNIQMEGVGEEHAVRFDLTQYFIDTNGKDGDELRYEIKNHNEDIVEARIEGDTFIVLPLAKGTASVTLFAYDLDGEMVHSAMTFIVKNGPQAPDPDPGHTGGMSLYPNPASEYLNILLESSAGSNCNIQVYDMAQRLALSENMSFGSDGIVRIDVSALVPGAYVITVDNGKGKWNGSFLKR